MLYRTPKLLQALYPTLTWQRDTSKKELYLTFDDGPIPNVTEFVLETLEKYNAKATFFCIGDNIRKHPEIFQKVVANGHAIGNHTMHHLKGWQTETSTYIENTSQCQEQIEMYSLPSEKKLFRPPYGRIKRQQIGELSNDYEIVMWTTLSQDYRADLSPETILKNTIKVTKPGSIILLHDSLKAEKNMRYVLPRLLETFSDYEFKAL
ncbi:polysaccharide deacetylase family protein [Arcticibacterium luteifluviistationis]|uniref:Polysaccharide deacetylase family protein n=1 Tax=Arcticibacterium luteifluviistationis TaxID=1784714 RepID=A0A2Z4GBC1_9BACT|nr:polysaccharide deacetylase family protein [Arcticibacterium luteifluviistationis]AWV98233.1 polysaccharide deacetylase family protein [Arcticibacterium luteifluviistationis]